MATRTITVGTAGVPLDREVGGTDLSTDRTAAEMRTALELGTAAVADADDFATATRTVGTGLGTSGTVNLDRRRRARHRTRSSSRQGQRMLTPFEGGVWESTIDANVWSPTAYPSGWKKV